MIFGITKLADIFQRVRLSIWKLSKCYLAKQIKAKPNYKLTRSKNLSNPKTFNQLNLTGILHILKRISNHQTRHKKDFINKISDKLNILCASFSGVP